MTALHGCELRPADVWHYRDQFDLHVVRAETDGASTAITVAEFQFLLHVAADAVLDVDVAMP
jgi:hypothetical protein